MTDHTQQTQADRRRALIAHLHELNAQPISERKWHWNFSQLRSTCGTVGCALGYANRLWPEADLLTIPLPMERIGDFFGLTTAKIDEIFFGFSGCYDAPNYRITPKMVADALQRTHDEIMRHQND